MPNDHLHPIMQQALNGFAPKEDNISKMDINQIRNDQINACQEIFEKREAELIRLIKEADRIEKEGLNCPDCPNQGWYVEGGGLQGYVSHEMAMDGGDMALEGQRIFSREEQVQCEFCETEPNSKFNLRRNWRAEVEKAGVNINE